MLQLDCYHDLYLFNWIIPQEKIKIGSFQAFSNVSCVSRSPMKYGYVFLPVGHTHQITDQSFSATANRLCHNDDFTLDDLHSQLRQTYNSHTKVLRTPCVVNWSGLVAAEKCLLPVKSFTKCWFFIFSKSSSTDTNSV